MAILTALLVSSGAVSQFIPIELKGKPMNEKDIVVDNKDFKS